MCIMFVYIDNSPPEGGYRLVVAANRDERFDKPTKPADFWQDDPNCISGLDKSRGTSHRGTWFAASKRGKIGSMLNILTPEDPHPDKIGRGHLVVDYMHQTTSASDYLQTLSHCDSSPNPYNLVLIEKNSSGAWVLHSFTNSPEATCPLNVFEAGIHCFGNSILEKPLKKVLYGEQKFRKIIETYGPQNNTERLHAALVNLMRDKTPTLPDPQLAIQCGNSRTGEVRNKLSAIFVDSYPIGTRTTTLLTVNADNHCTYSEHTMREPINAHRPNWLTSTYNFTI